METNYFYNKQHLCRITYKNYEFTVIFNLLFFQDWTVKQIHAFLNPLNATDYVGQEITDERGRVLSFRYFIKLIQNFQVNFTTEYLC